MDNFRGAAWQGKKERYWYNDTTPMDLFGAGINLNPVEYLGIEAVRAGVPRWHAAMAEGRRRAPKCDFILRDGRGAGNASIREARKLNPPVHRCRLHMPKEVWTRIDHLRRRRGRMLAASANEAKRAEGLAMLRQIEIREILNRWAINPEIEASIFEVTPGDQRRIDEWLAAHGYDLDHLDETGRPMTPCRRNFVHLRVTLHLSGRLTERLAIKSIRSAIHRDVKWFAAKAEAEAELPAWDSDPDDPAWQQSQ